jgi:hypothetical protein
MSIPVLCGYLIFKITDAFGFSIISECSNHLFWFFEKKPELENHWLWVFQKHQRTASFKNISGSVLSKNKKSES